MDMNCEIHFDPQVLGDAAAATIINVMPIISMIEDAMDGVPSRPEIDLYQMAAAIQKVLPPVKKIKDEIAKWPADYTNQHAAALKCLENDLLLYSFVNRLQWPDVSHLLDDSLESDWLDMSAEERTEALINNISIGDFISLYEKINGKEPILRSYRTEEKAEVDTDFPRQMAIITDKRYQYAMSFRRNSYAYLLQLCSIEGIEDAGSKGLVLTEKEIKERITKDGIADTDIALLSAVYSLFLAKIRKEGFDEEGRFQRKNIPESITVYFPQFIEFIGMTRNISLDRADELLTGFERFKNIVGSIWIIEKSDRDGTERKVLRFFPTLIVKEYNKEKNTIELSSPYLVRLIEMVFTDNIRRNRKGQVIYSRSNTVQYDPSHSFLIKPSIAKHKNAAAVENVYIIVTLIEQTGNPKKGQNKIVPNIKAAELVNRNEILKARLAAAASNSYKTKLLKRCFEKTYELLKTETWLCEKYKDLIIPNDIPTFRNLQQITLRFPHAGRNDP